MALSPDENYMALVNNRDINIVDLNSLAIIDTYSFNESIHSIVYGPDEILYVFLSYSYNYLFHTINLDTKVTTPYDFNTSSYDSYDAILHPSQKYIYALEDDYSYNSFLKINISTGIPELSYTASFNDIDSPWWMCNNGQRFIFSDGEYMEVNAETAGIDFGDFQYIPIQGTSINELCYESSGNGYYINPKSTNSYYFDNQVRYYDAQFNLLETFFSEDYISTDNNNGVPGYQYIEGSIQKMFYDDSRQELILITKTRNNYYNSSNGIEIIKR